MRERSYSGSVRIAAAPRELRRALDAVAPKPYRGLAYRHHAAAYGALSGDGARVHGGRWNPPGSFATVYAASDPPTVDAEYRRALGRARLAGVRMAPRLLSTLRLDLRRVLDLRDGEVLAALGVTQEQLRADDPALPRMIGEVAHEAGFEAIVAPSASAAEGDVLALFPDRLANGSKVDIVGVRPYPGGPD